MKKRFLFFLILFSLFLPKIILAADVDMKEKDEDEMLRLVNKGVYNEWENVTLSNDFSIERQAILITLHRNLQFKILNSILKQVEKTGLIWTLRVATVLLEPKAAVIIGEVEKLTVDAAKNYAMDWLTQNQIKTGNGNLNFNYKAVDGKIESGIFPYIIAYKPVGIDMREVVMHIYSAKTIKSPEGNLIYQWEGGIDKIPPFILEIKGQVVRTDLGAYRWTKGPEFNFIFNQPVPKLDFKEPTIIDEVKTQLDKIGQLLEKGFNLTKGTVTKTVTKVQDVWGSITGFIAKIKGFGGSSLASAPVLSQEESQSFAIDITSQFKKLKEGAIEFMQGLQQSNPPAIDNSGDEDRIDDLKEEIDVLAQRITDLQNLASTLKANELALLQTNEEEDVQLELIPPVIENKPIVVLTSTPPRSSGGSGGSPAPSYCSISNAAPLSNTIKFAQIGWNGNEQSASNEWIELKNLTSQAINLGGWQVLDKDMQIKVVFPSGKEIGPNQIFLMERTDDNSVLDRSADFIYTGALNNEDEILYLFDNNCTLQDRITNIQSVLDVESESSEETVNLPEESEPEPEEILSQKILINEIAWMGTLASANDEWIELFNPNEEPVEIAGWNLLFYSSGKTEPSINLNFSILENATPTITSSGYFLLERTDDDSVKGTKADRIYTGALNDGGGILELKDTKGNLVDRIDFSAGWPAGDKEKRVSMERYDQNTWKTNNLLVHNSYDASENYIYGTPRAKNSVVQTGIEILPLPFDKFDKITLPFYSSPYFIGYSEITVPESKILLIEPGVKIQFLNNIGRIVVEGTLEAIGAEENKIIFTSAKENPVPGDWRQIYFKETSTNSKLENILLEFGGGDPAGTPCSPDMAGIKIEKAKVLITNSTIKNNLGRGILSIDSNSEIDKVEISDNIVCHTAYNDYGGYGIEARRGSLKINNSNFKNQPAGIWSEGSNALISDNNFENNQKPIISYASADLISGNTAQNNDLDGVYVFGSGGILQPTEWKNNLPYFVSGMLNIIQDASLTIDAGVTVKFADNYSGVKADGTLKVNGVEGSEVLFTSDNHTPGAWDKIEIMPSSQNSEINSAIIEYARYGLYIASGNPFWENLSFSLNVCNIFKDNNCIDPIAEP
jgi:parallel beta-helix repeat protein